MSRRAPYVSRLKRRRDVERLIDALHYQDKLVDPRGRVIDLGSHVRLRAVWALSEMGDPRAIDAISTLALVDENKWVRKQATRALESRGQPTGPPQPAGESLPVVDAVGGPEATDASAQAPNTAGARDWDAAAVAPAALFGGGDCGPRESAEQPLGKDAEGEARRAEADKQKLGELQASRDEHLPRLEEAHGVLEGVRTAHAVELEESRQQSVDRLAAAIGAQEESEQRATALEDELGEAGERFERELGEVRGQLVTLESELGHVAERRLELERELADTQALLSAREESEAALTGELGVLQGWLGELQASRDELVPWLEEAHRVLEAQRARAVELEESRQQLVDRLAAAIGAQEESEQRATALEDELGETGERFERELGEVRGQLVTLESELGHVAERRLELEQELANTQALLSARQQSAAALQDELGVLQGRLGELLASRDELVPWLEEAHRVLEALRERAVELGESRQQLADRLAAAIGTQEESEQRATALEDELGEAGEQQEAHEREVAQTRERRAAFKQAVAESNQKLATLEDELAQAHELRADYAEEVLSTFPPEPGLHAQAEPAGVVSEEAEPAAPRERAPEWRERDVVEHEAFAPGEPLGTESGRQTPMRSEATQSGQPAEPVVEEPERADVPFVEEPEETATAEGPGPPAGRRGWRKSRRRRQCHSATTPMEPAAAASCVICGRSVPEFPEGADRDLVSSSGPGMDPAIICGECENAGWQLKPPVGAEAPDAGSGPVMPDDS